MHYFKDYENFSNNEIELKLLQINESNLSSFLQFIVDKIKKAVDIAEVKRIVENVILKTLQVKKEMIPVLVSALLLVTPLQEIVSESTVLEKNQKEFLLKIITKRNEEAEISRISKISADFLDTLAYKESRKDWTTSNNFGYIGKYQFGYIAFLDTYNQFKPAYLKKIKGTKKEKINTLIRDFTRYSREIMKYKNDTTLTFQKREAKIHRAENNLKKIFPLEEQEIVMKNVISNNEKYLRNFKKHIGREINNVKITWSGMIAAAHLKGASSVKVYLESDGKDIPEDYFGTSVEAYMKLFK